MNSIEFLPWMLKPILSLVSSPIRKTPLGPTKCIPQWVRFRQGQHQTRLATAGLNCTVQLWRWGTQYTLSLVGWLVPHLTKIFATKTLKFWGPGGWGCWWKLVTLCPLSPFCFMSVEHWLSSLTQQDKARGVNFDTVDLVQTPGQHKCKSEVTTLLSIVNRGWE